MSKVTTKLQVTLPKAIADRFGIRPGDEIEWSSAGDGIRVEPVGRGRPALDRSDRLKLFDQATARQKRRNIAWKGKLPAGGRGWSREDLYDERTRPD